MQILSGDSGELVNETINVYDINNYFINNLTSLLNEKKNKFFQIAKNYDFEETISGKNFTFSEWVSQQIEPNHEESIKFINEAISPNNPNTNYSNYI